MRALYKTPLCHILSPQFPTNALFCLLFRNEYTEQILQLQPIIPNIIYRIIQNDCRGTTVQRQFRTKFGKQPPSDNSIRRRYAQFQDTGCVCIPVLKVRIRTATETITADMLQTVWDELDYRVDVCRITKGGHIEHL